MPTDIHEAQEIRDQITRHVPTTTVTHLARRGVERVRVVHMGTLEKLFEVALERALKRTLARLPSPARAVFEREAREELRVLVKEDLRAVAASEPASPRKQALLEVVFQENLALRARRAG